MAYPSSRPAKRKLTLLEDGAAPRPKRISPFLNTPKQRREEKRKVLRMSIQKLRQIDDPECLLHRSVLINNTMKRMQNELREEKPKSSHWWSHWEVYGETTVSDTTGAGSRATESRDEKLSHFDYEMINNDHLAFNSHLFDNDPDVDKMTKEMTEALCKTVDSIDRDHSSWSAKHESVVISASSSCSSPSSTSAAAAAASSSDDEPLNLSTPKRTKDTSVQSSSCDSQKVDSTTSPSRLRQVSNDTTTTTANTCLCLSVSVCDCDIISKDPAPVCDFSDLSMDTTTSTHKQSESSFFSINSATTSPDTSTSCFDNFGKVDFDFDCFPSVSDHERHMNEFDAVFNNLISVLTGS